MLHPVELAKFDVMGLNPFVTIAVNAPVAARNAITTRYPNVAVPTRRPVHVNVWREKQMKALRVEPDVEPLRPMRKTMLLTITVVSFHRSRFHLRLLAKMRIPRSILCLPPTKVVASNPLTSVPALAMV